MSIDVLEKQAILKIVELSLETEYEDRQEARLAMHRFSESAYANTNFGKRYLSRLEKITEDDESEDRCILCNTNIAGNCVICGDCIGNLIPILQKAKAKNASSKKEDSDSKKPSEIALALKESVNRIQKENDREYALIDLIEGEKQYSVFLGTKTYRIISEFDNTEIASLEISHIKLKSVEAALEVQAPAWAELLSKVLIDLMEPALSEERIEEIYESALSESGPYFYKGLYYTGEKTDVRHSFKVGTEIYEKEIHDAVAKAGATTSSLGFDMAELLGSDDISSFISQFKKVEQRKQAYTLDQAITIELAEGEVHKIEIFGYTGYQLMNFSYAQPENTALIRLNEICSNVYKDLTLGFKSRYKYKGKTSYRGEEFHIEVSVFCGYVSGISISRR